MEETLPELKKPWLRCVGSDRMSTMLRRDYWENFTLAQAALGFDFIRCHGLLGDDLGVLRIDRTDQGPRVFHNFSYLDQIFDTMLAHGVRPFLELGFMPGALASGPQTVFWWKGFITPPTSLELWADLIGALFVHWGKRYGRDEVRRWPVEVWNEPNLDQFWWQKDQGAYFALYEATVKAIKAVDPGIRVGGPAICGGSDHWIDDFLGFVKARSLPLDFFTRHLYAGKTPSFRNEEVFYQALVPPGDPVEELRQVRQRVDRAGFPGLEIHITEFNTSYHPLCPVHDTPYNAAYLARLLSESGDLVETLSYWTFCDVFEEADIPRAFFHGGFGLLARDGIPKPTFHLFTFFKALGARVLSRTENTLATLRDDGTAAVAAWNPVAEAEASPPLAQAVTLPWTGGPALVRRRRVHDGAGNPWGLWVRLGRPRFPDRATVDFLRDGARPALETAVLAPRDGVLTLDFTLARNEVTLLEILPFEDQTPGYPGLDDGRIDGYTGESNRQEGLS